MSEELQYEKSCGAVVYCRKDNGIQYLLACERSGYWVFPKGHMEAGESELQTALRELKEETGLSASLDTNRIASVEYSISSFAKKEVVFYLGEVKGVPKVREDEIEKFKWVTADELDNYLFPDICEACKELLR